MVGQTVGKYRVEERIGRGGMGTVYRAVDQTLHREVAIKVLNSELNDPEIAKRFRAEAITVARLSHPGIATIYELFEYDGSWLMVMEFVRGETLERLVERAGALSAERAAELTMQALGALGHAHNQGVVHRDLKPANLMLTEAGVVKIMDFGIARVTGSEHLTNAGYMMGTPAYMAPEQVLSHEIDSRADLYAMGVVMYRLTTGRLPFNGATPFALAQSQVNDPPTPIRTARQGLPEWLEQVVAVALAKSPANRFQTAEAFRATLERCLAGMPLVAALDTSTPTGMMQTPARPALSTLAAQTPYGTRIPSTVTPAMTPADPSTAGLGSPATPVSGSSPLLSEMPTQMSSTAGLTAPTGVQSASSPSGRVKVPAELKAAAPKKALSTTTLTTLAAAVVVLGIGIAAAFSWSRHQRPPAPAPAAAVSDAPAASDRAVAPPIAAAPPTEQAAEAPVSPAPPKTTAPVPPGAPPATPKSAAAGHSPPASPGPSAPAKADAASANPAGRATPAAPPAAVAPPPAVPDAPPAPPIDDSFVTFKDIKFMAVKGGDSQDQDAMVNFGGGEITVVPKDGGTAYASMPYTVVAHATYVHTKDPKWDATLPAPPGNLTIHGFMRGARHWLALQSKTSYVLLRLDDSNWRGILDAIENRCRMKVDRPTEGGV